MSTPISPMAPTKCKKCMADAKEVCKGCKEDPGASGDHVKTYYCSSACQQEDWAAHKSECQRVQVCKDVYRTGDFLQAMFYKWKETVWNGQIGKVDEDDGNLRVHFYGQTESNGIGLVNGLQFPKHLVLNRKDKLGILALSACDESIAYTHDLAKYLLKGLCAQIHELTVVPKNPKRHIVSMYEDGQDDSEDREHAVLYLVLARDGGHHILDLTGAQYGYFQAVTPATEYMTGRVSMDVALPDRDDFGTRKLAFEYRLGHPATDFPGATPELIQHGKTHGYIKYATSQHFLRTTENWLMQQNMTVKEFLKLDKNAYETSKKELVQQFEVDVQSEIKTLETEALAHNVQEVYMQADM